MKKIFAVAMAFLLIALAAIPAFAVTGNGAPNGEHFNLNIIGVQHDKGVVKDSGNVIFVPLNTTGRISRTGLANAVDILLAPAPAGEGFAVLDGNATNDNEAKFQMPADVATTYAVYIRGLGKPTDSAADMQAWGFVWDPIALEWVYTGGTVVQIRGHSVNDAAKQKFVDVTSDLLTINGVPVFDPAYEGYLWTYSNNGQKLVQLRFYPLAP